MPGKAIGYIRVSTEERAREDVRLDAQGECLKSYVSMQGLELIDLVSVANIGSDQPFALPRLDTNDIPVSRS